MPEPEETKIAGRQNKDRTHTELVLLAELQSFLDELERAGPLLAEGEEHSLLIRGGIGDLDEQDAPVYSLSVRHTRERNL
jgi:hypothetical protein